VSGFRDITLSTVHKVFLYLERFRRGAAHSVTDRQTDRQTTQQQRGFNDVRRALKAGGVGITQARRAGRQRTANFAIIACNSIINHNRAIIMRLLLCPQPINTLCRATPHLLRTPTITLERARIKTGRYLPITPLDSPCQRQQLDPSWHTYLQ